MCFYIFTFTFILSLLLFNSILLFYQSCIFVLQLVCIYSYFQLTYPILLPTTTNLFLSDYFPFRPCPSVCQLFPFQNCPFRNCQVYKRRTADIRDVRIQYQYLSPRFRANGSDIYYFSNLVMAISSNRKSSTFPHSTNKAIRKILLTACPDLYFSTIKHPCTGYATVTIFQMLTHLWRHQTRRH